MRRIAVVGTTAWGTTLAVMLANKGMEVILWARTEEEAEKLNQDRGNVAHLPNILFPQNLRATASPSEALERAELTILSVPAQTMRRNLKLIKQHIPDSTLIMSVSKGIEVDTTKRMSQVIAEEISSNLNVVVLSGPNFSKEVIQGMPTATVVAARNTKVAKEVQRIMASPNFRVYINKDVIGVELGGALKNVIALAAGMSDGLGYGDNTRSALITRGLAEITRLGVAAGARSLTFSGLSGLGDLVATCSSKLSRNRFVGQELAKGRPLKEILSSMKSVAEGVDTVVAAVKLARRLGVEMPIMEQVYQVLFEGLEVKQAVPALMERGLKHEWHQ